MKTILTSQIGHRFTLIKQIMTFLRVWTLVVHTIHTTISRCSNAHVYLHALASMRTYSYICILMHSYCAGQHSVSHIATLRASVFSISSILCIICLCVYIICKTTLMVIRISSLYVYLYRVIILFNFFHYTSSLMTCALWQLLL